MEWFKHKSGSHDDPDISDACDKFRDAGYMTFFVLCEIYAQEFRHIKPDGFLIISLAFVRRKLRKSSAKVQEILRFYQERERLEFNVQNNRIAFKIQGFIDLASNWTRREKVLPTGVPTEAPTAKEVEEEVEVEEDKKKKLLMPEAEKSASRTTSPQPLKISFSYEKGLFENIKQSYLDQWSKAYPAISVYPEIRKMEAWASANPKNRKSNWQRFIVNWLTKAQDRAGTDRSQSQRSSIQDDGHETPDYAKLMKEKKKRNRDKIAQERT